MIYLDNGATSFPKPACVHRAMGRAMARCGNPGRGGYPAAMEASKLVFRCREAVGEMFSCKPEQVVFTSNCTHGLNLAIKTLVKPGDRVVISGFEHNAVTRPLHSLGAEILVAGRKLFDWQDTLAAMEKALDQHPAAAVFTHVSNVFGYILPLDQLCRMCRQRGIPFIIDAAQSAGYLPLSLEDTGADFIAMPGHKGLLGPQGTGILLCAKPPASLIQGGTGSNSTLQEMPDFTPDVAEAGTVNVPGIGGLLAGIQYLNGSDLAQTLRRQQEQSEICAHHLQKMGIRVFTGQHRGGTLSFLPDEDCETVAAAFARENIALRAGLHCAPLAHESAGTLPGGTVRLSFGHLASKAQTDAFLRAASKVLLRKL